MTDTSPASNGARIRLGDWLVIASVIGGLFVFGLRYENRLTVVETAQAGQTSVLQDIREELRELRRLLVGRRP